MSILASRSIFSMPISVAGVGASYPLSEMREVETTTVSVVSAFSCAWAQIGATIAASNVTGRIRRKTDMTGLWHSLWNQALFNAPMMNELTLGQGFQPVKPVREFRIADSSSLCDQRPHRAYSSRLLKRRWIVRYHIYATEFNGARKCLRGPGFSN
jgi:hypothetical protein